MRILILTPSIYPEPGGLQRYTYYLAASLAGQGHQVLVFALKSRSDFVADQANISYTSVEQWGRVEDGSSLLDRVRQKYYLLNALWKNIERFQPDRLICTWWEPLGYLAAMLNLVYRRPYLCVGHGQEVLRLPHHPLKRWLKRVLRNFAFQSATRVIAVSNFTREALIENIGLTQHKVSFVPNGLSPEYIVTARTFSRDSSRSMLGIEGYIILQVGRLVPRKGHELVLEVLNEVQKQLDAPIRYVIVGSGMYQEKLRQRAAALGIEDSVLFAGFVPDDQLHLYYSAADLIVMPAHNAEDPGDIEGFGIVYLEAYAHSKPVIGARAGGVLDAVLDGETGKLIPPGSALILKEEILTLLQNPRRATEMGNQGMRLLEQRWNWHQLCRSFIS